MKRVVFALSLLFAAQSTSFALQAQSHTQDKENNNSNVGNSQNNIQLYKPATIECVIEAANSQGVPPNVLLGIASIEMGANGAKLKNTNGSLDLGHFGINTIHFKPGEPLAKAGIKQEDVTYHGCYNAQVAAWLLARHLHAKRGDSFWVWAANYHSMTPKHNAVYRKKLIRYSKQWSLWLQNRYPQVSIYQPQEIEGK